MCDIRNRAWRRFQASIRQRGSKAVPWKLEKKWKLMYLRSEKLNRARQLGFEYPLRSTRQMLDAELPRDGV